MINIDVLIFISNVVLIAIGIVGLYLDIKE